MLQFIAGLALLGVTTWLVNRWLGLFGAENFYPAAGLLFVLMCLIAWIYDRRQAKLQKSNDLTQPDWTTRES
jgi:cell division protein FtsW (lipid II flippase)